MLTSHFMRDLAWPIGINVAIATTVGLYETGLEQWWPSAELPNIATAAPEVYAQTSFALSLMLVWPRLRCAGCPGL
jgi:hypothetical protein